LQGAARRRPPGVLGPPARGWRMSESDRRDMFGASGFGDTSGFGGLAVREPDVASTPKPYGGWFDEATDALEQALPQYADSIERVVVHRGELTLFVKRE